MGISTFDGKPAVVLRAGATEATFLPSLGMLGVSLRDDGDELLDLSAGLAAYRAQHTTGLPLLAPWANRLGGWEYSAAGVDVNLAGLPLHTDENGLPIHGTMLARPEWELTGVEPDTLRARFRFGDRPDLLASFPFPHDIGFEAVVTDGALTVTTSIEPTGDRPVPVSFGYHPYFRLPAAPRDSWTLTLPARRRVVLDARGLPTGETTPMEPESTVVGDSSLDDHFALGDDRRLSLSGGGRRVVLDYEDGYPFAQVFSPAGKEFVAIEPMTAATDALRAGTCPRVEPGRAFTARFSVRIDRASP
ncbi:MAG: aldose 1-epimerase [Acidimicrobiales bacterium]